MCSSQGSHRFTVRGSPIRASTDRGMCAPPRRLSQLTTPFLASARLGIHRVPLVACQPNSAHLQTFPKNSHAHLSTNVRFRLVSESLPILLSKSLDAPAEAETPNRDRPHTNGRNRKTLEMVDRERTLVEVRGLEPLTPYLQNRCSAS